jgi:hypothetical protein
MLKVERLVCQNQQFHKKCYWSTIPANYPDARYDTLKKRLMTESKKTHDAFRIVKNNLYVLATIKYGHDGNIFVSETK